MLNGSVNAMCSNGRAGSLVGHGQLGGEGGDRRGRRQHASRTARQARDRGIAHRAHLAVAAEHLLAASEPGAAARPFDDEGQHLARAALRAARGCRATSAVRQKPSMPSAIARVVNGATGSTMAPAGFEGACRGLDGRAHLGLDRQAPAGIEQQADAQAAQRRGRAASQAMSWYGRLIVSRASGRLSTPIISAASATRARHRPGHAAGVRRVDRDAAEAGLEREDAAPAGRQAHRAADVGADVQRPVAGGARRRRRRRCCRRGPATGPRDCASADGSSTGPTTACRSRASSSCRGSPRRPRAAAPPAARRVRRGTSSVGGGAERHRHARVAMFSLIITGTPSSAPCGAPLRQRACDASACASARVGVERVGRVQLRLPARRCAQHGARHLDRRQRPSR